MKIYLISIATGLLVGVIYAGLGVRSPAPPAIALLGLLGMLVGEQIVPAVKRLAAGEPVTARWFQSECVPRIMGTPNTVLAPKTKTAAARPPLDEA